MANQMLPLLDQYETLLARKDELEALAKENAAQIGEVKEAIVSQMIEDDTPRISYKGRAYSLTAKTAYSKRSDSALAAAGLDFFQVLRGEGLGGLIKETVNPRSLQSALKDYAEQHGGLSEELEAVVTSYDYSDITRRKDSRRK